MTFSGGSIDQKATLYQLKAKFNHKNASSDVFGSFNHTEELIRLSAECYITLLLMEKSNIKNYDSHPDSNAPGSRATDEKEARRTFFNQVLEAAADEIDIFPSEEEINRVIEADLKKTVWCYCFPGNSYKVFSQNVTIL